MEGRFMSMVLQPKAGAVKKQPEGDTVNTAPVPEH
jgi:hypothetical protein